MIGKFVYKYFFKPTLPLRYNLSHFGVRGTWSLITGERQMKLAALRSKPVTLVSDANCLEINFLTGKKYWHQTIFCIRSIISVYGTSLKISIYSDGSIDENVYTYLNRFCKELIFVNEEEVEKRLKKFIPSDTFPYLNRLRTWHPFFRRMLDIHLQDSWQIHLDSDMLFFDRPEEIVSAAKQKTAIFMKERLEHSYFVDSRENIEKNLDMNVIEKVNGGIVAYDGSKVDLQDLEAKAKLMLAKYPNAIPAMVEQTLMSYILHNQNAKALSERYKIHYGDDEILEDSCVKHYIFRSKLDYLSKEWKKF